MGEGAWAWAGGPAARLPEGRVKWLGAAPNSPPGTATVGAMQIARVSRDGGPRYGIVDEETEDLVMLAGDPLFQGLATTGERVPRSQAKLLAPVIPRSKVIGVGANFAADPAERERLAGEPPVLFFKPNTCVIGPDEPIVWPDYAPRLACEPELAIIISRPCRQVPLERAEDVIYGYTVANDVTAQFDGPTQWVAGKAFDTSCPIGPVMDLDFTSGTIIGRVNGEEQVRGELSDMVRNPLQLIVEITKICTLLPGDIILTGTPGAMVTEEGDVAECEIAGLGVLSNEIRR